MKIQINNFKTVKDEYDNYAYVIEANTLKDIFQQIENEFNDLERRHFHLRDRVNNIMINANVLDY